MMFWDELKFLLSSNIEEKMLHFKMAGDSDRGDFRAYSVEILVFVGPTGYMLISSGFPLLNWGIFYIVLKNDR
jgi:hypothetical protein